MSRPTRGPDLHGLFSDGPRQDELPPLTDAQMEFLHRKANGIEKEAELKDDVTRLRYAAEQLDKACARLEGLHDTKLRNNITEILSSEANTLRGVAERKVKEVNRITHIKNGEDPEKVGKPGRKPGTYRGGSKLFKGKSIHDV